ncbi:WD40 repeat-like protein [Mytilinidion resinicola]|uniref:WD40 repeat-like protein n=1 Tax=Mytilinidion resinicola TaxID=574789 RepID=A0A6A6Z1T6_9PEZI|nr:WD40 repeat-like protein [Mytilinidion resinicola]KAF2814960.1 WD40 repeat-like protein [Mytilinidion resinicola]
MNTSTKGRVPTGYAEETFLSEATFRAAHRSIEINPSSNPKKRKREGKGDPGSVFGASAYKGPWAKFEQEKPDAASDEEYGEDEEVEVVYEEDEIEEQPEAPASKLGTAYGDALGEKETSEFVGSQQYDYQGRTYMHVPTDLDINLRGDREGIKNFIPKKLLHNFKYHTKSITQLRFFPDSGHLLLSASADNKIALWDVYHDRELLRTFSGHTKSVNDIDFNPSGTQFLSASYDRYMKLWDTETGKCLNKFTSGKTPHVVRFNPSMPNEFLAGMSDKKILQYDVRSGDLVQEYDHHLGPVNTITFCDEDRRFITTSDDKSLRAWEYGIPVPIKFIAEPYMYSMVRSATHPSGKYAAFQSSDNQIVVYAASDRFRQNRKKSFRGHNVSGYAPDVAISPDGQFVASGDSGGYVCFWDWKTCKMWHKIQASDAPLLAVQWHPRETSKVITGDLNGAIKYWD